MKFRTTQKEVNRSYVNRIAVGYCNLQHLLNCKSPVAYTAGQYGWGADVYDFGSTAIITGYAPFGNIRPDYDTCKRYDTAAEKICYGTVDWNEKNEQLSALVDKFIGEVTNREVSHDDGQGTLSHDDDPER